ncbi:MAG: pilus assembly protein PilP [Gammaproteobacteria bacterium]|nr:pilus assembly protein PilP [Gammaproteobacteria bacterium]
MTLLLLSGCGDNMGDLKRYVAQVKAHKVTQIPPVPQITPYQPFTYTAEGRRDPFQPQAGAPPPSSSSSKLRPDINRPREPLEEFPLDSLSMVGVITFKGATYAMIKAPDGVIHRVTIGDHMGQNYGKVIKITDHEIDLVEVVPNGFGGWEERPATVSLAE